MNTIITKNKTIFLLSGVVVNFLLFYISNFLLGFLVNLGINDSLAMQIILFIYLVLPIILLIIWQRKNLKYRYLALGWVGGFILLLFGIFVLGFPFSWGF